MKKLLGILVLGLLIVGCVQSEKKLKKQAQVQENTEITFMSAWFVMGVF